jgi:Phosphotransferase enzyme family
MAGVPRRCWPLRAARSGRTRPRRPRGTGTPAGRGGRRAHSGAAGRRPGRVDWWPSDLDRWLEQLAGLLPLIHGTALPSAETLPRFAPYRQENYRPPGWARYPRVWERAVEISRGPAPDLPPVLLRRDFHPGNVLWRYGRVSGVVDWLGACSGPAPADVAHCRIDLLTMGTEVAPRFTVHWEQVAGTTYHPWGDVVIVVGFLDDLPSTTSAAAARPTNRAWLSRRPRGLHRGCRSRHRR